MTETGKWDYSRVLKGCTPLSYRETNKSFSPDQDQGPQCMGVQNSCFGALYDGDLVGHSSLPHCRKQLTLHPAN